MKFAYVQKLEKKVYLDNEESWQPEGKRVL